jgi:hypothetical protein
MALEPLPNPIWLLILITIALYFAARDAELNQLKMLVEKLANKVNARGDTPAEHLAAVENLVDEVATHGIRLGTTLGLAAMATHTGVDYSTGRAASKTARRRTSTRSRSSWSASTATATPLPNSLVPSLC